MEPVTEDLSRLLAGELPPAEAAALRARIEADPALRRAWARMQGLPGALGSLPLSEPPQTLRVAANTLPVASRRPVFVLASALALTAAALLAVWSRGPLPVRLDAGVIQTDGAALIVVPGGLVRADGKVRVAVEPDGGLARGMVLEAPMKTHLLSAAGGAVLTIAVLEGKARYEPDQGTPVEIAAGETRAVGEPAAAPDRPAYSTTPKDEAGRQDLEDQVKALELQLAVARGQLAQIEGTPAAWPAALPEPLRPAAFEATASGVAASVPGTKLLRVDCDEYPCVAFFSANEPGPDWGRSIGEAMHGLAGEDGNVWQQASISDSSGAPVGISAIAVSPGGDEDASRDISRRLQSRVEPIMEELSEAAPGE